MIYVDTSVALAHLLAEDRKPGPSLWRNELVSSRLLEYEVWNRIHARALERSHGDAVRALLDRVSLVEMGREVLGHVREPFPRPVRTLDALHLATVLFLTAQGLNIQLATYDGRMLEAAGPLGIDAVLPDDF